MSNLIQVRIECIPIPNSEAMAMKNIAKAYFVCHQAAQAADTAYMAHEDGNRAVLEINIPAENS